MLSYYTPTNISKNRRVAWYGPNITGRDFICGDPHGYFTLLRRLLALVGFDGSKDRLFIAGDLVDRGPESDQVVEFLDQPWVFAVRGNHEQWCIEAVFDEPNPAHIAHGGLWFYGLPTSEREEIAIRLNDLPVAIEIAGADGRRYGIVHAECTHHNWPLFTEALSGALTEPYAIYHSDRAIWRRRRFEKKIKSPISGVDLIYVGHSVTPEVIDLGNVRYLDTGACFEGGELTIAELGMERKLFSVRR